MQQQQQHTDIHAAEGPLHVCVRLCAAPRLAYPPPPPDVLLVSADALQLQQSNFVHHLVHIDLIIVVLLLRGYTLCIAAAAATIQYRRKE
jgi:hypothetical protein